MTVLAETGEACSKCGRSRPTNIADPSCFHGGYCNWVAVQVAVQKTRLCCACGTERDAAQDWRLELMADGGFRLLEPAPLVEPPSNDMLRSCRGCGATYLPAAQRERASLGTPSKFQVDVLAAHSRIMRSSVAAASMVTLDELDGLIAVYRHHHARCESCGFERSEHNQSPACAAFSEE